MGMCPSTRDLPTDLGKRRNGGTILIEDGGMGVPCNKSGHLQKYYQQHDPIYQRG